MNYDTAWEKTKQTLIEQVGHLHYIWCKAQLASSEMSYRVVLLQQANGIPTGMRKHVKNQKSYFTHSVLKEGWIKVLVESVFKLYI